MLKALFILTFFEVLGCTSNKTETPETNQGSTIKKDSIVKVTYPVNPLHILTEEEEGGGADIRLSITEIIQIDSFIYYKVLSTYNQKNIGFEIRIPSKPELKAPLQFNSTGQSSNDFLQVLSKLYKVKTDASKKFVTNLETAFIDMNEFAKKELGQEISGIAGLKELKLFFESENEKDYAELYININEKDHWIEVQEKDPEYRKPILKALSIQ